jgi:hypothetical protein
MRRVLAGLALVIVCALGATPVEAETLSSREHNYSLELPPGWTREGMKPAWEKDHIVDGARRLVEKLFDGKPAKGQGAQMHFSVMPAPEGKSLADLAADPAQREFLLRLFGASSAWPAVEVEETTIKGEVGGETPGVRLVAKGTALNLQAEAGPCRAYLILAVVKKKLYRLRLVAWTSAHDDEGLGSDLDAIDINYQLLDVTEDKPKEPRPGPPKEGDDPNAEEPPQGDAGEEKLVQDEVQGWRFTKPKKIATKEIDKETYPYVVSMLEANDRSGSVSFMLSAYQNGMVLNGRVAPDQDIRKWITTSWWATALADYKDGALSTFPFPANRPNQTFLTLPNFEKEHVIAETPKKRELEPSPGDVEKKFKMVESVKGTLGKEKAGEAWRGVIKGNRERIGQDVSMRYAWRTARYTFMLHINIARDGLPKYGPVIEQLLKSFELTK